MNSERFLLEGGDGQQSKPTIQTENKSEGDPGGFMEKEAAFVRNLKEV